MIEWAIESFDTGTESLASRIDEATDEDSQSEEQATAGDFRKHRSKYALKKLGKETFPLDDIGANERDINTELLGIIQDLAIEKTDVGTSGGTFYSVECSISEDGLVSTYQAKVGQVVESIANAETVQTIFYFPMNIQWEHSAPEFEIFDLSIDPISESDWERKLREFAEIPNITQAGTLDHLTDGCEFTYYSISVESTRPKYAANKAQRALNMWCAKLNFSLLRWDNSFLRERNGRKHSTDPRWTRITSPIAMMVEVSEQPEEIRILDRDPRFEVELEWQESESKTVYEQLPAFEYRSEGTERVLQDALFTYQRAMVRPRMQSAFFEFWRCIEGLSLAGHGEKGKIIDRTLWALENVDDAEDNSFIRNIVGQLYSTRNEWVHDANWRDIWPIHEKVTKYLTETMIQFYVNGVHNRSKQELEELFYLAQMEKPQREKKYQQANNRTQAYEIFQEIDPD